MVNLGFAREPFNSLVTGLGVDVGAPFFVLHLDLGVVGAASCRSRCRPPSSSVVVPR